MSASALLEDKSREDKESEEDNLDTETHDDHLLPDLHIVRVILVCTTHDTATPRLDACGEKGGSEKEE
ncbi:unnamed protein product [Alternaria alternata]